MRMLLFTIAVLTFLAGLLIFVGSRSSIHEIEATAMFIVSAICLSGAGIIEAVNALRHEVARAGTSGLHNS